MKRTQGAASAACSNNSRSFFSLSPETPDTISGADTCKVKVSIEDKLGLEDRGHLDEGQLELSRDGVGQQSLAAARGTVEQESSVANNVR